MEFKLFHNPIGAFCRKAVYNDGKGNIKFADHGRKTLIDDQYQLFCSICAVRSRDDACGSWRTVDGDERWRKPAPLLAAAGVLPAGQRRDQHYCRQA